MRIAVSDDILRHFHNGLESHPANRVTLRGALQFTARSASVSITNISSSSADVELSVLELMKALDIPPGQKGWAQAWDAEPTLEFTQILARAFAGFDLVIGWGLSNLIVRTLEYLGIGYFDVELSPYRYAQDYYFMIRTNVAELAPVIRAHEVGVPTLAAIAGELNAFHNRRRLEYLAGPSMRCGVLFGQTPIDAALISDGRIATIDQFLESIHQWSAPLDRIFFKEHPHGDGTAFAWLRNHFRVERLTQPPYQILSANDIDRVAAISSGICTEAQSFAIPATMFITNPRHSFKSSAKNFYSSLAVHCACLNHALASLVGAEPPAASFHPDYRNIFTSSWGERFARCEPPGSAANLSKRLAARLKAAISPINLTGK